MNNDDDQFEDYIGVEESVGDAADNPRDGSNNGQGIIVLGNVQNGQGGYQQVRTDERQLKQVEQGQELGDDKITQDHQQLSKHHSQRNQPQHMDPTQPLQNQTIPTVFPQHPHPNPPPITSAHPHQTPLQPLSTPFQHNTQLYNYQQQQYLSLQKKISQQVQIIEDNVKQVSNGDDQLRFGRNQMARLDSQREYKCDVNWGKGNQEEVKEQHVAKVQQVSSVDDQVYHVTQQDKLQLGLTLNYKHHLIHQQYPIPATQPQPAHHLYPQKPPQPSIPPELQHSTNQPTPTSPQPQSEQLTSNPTTPPMQPFIQTIPQPPTIDSSILSFLNSLPDYTKICQKAFIANDDFL